MARTDKYFQFPISILQEKWNDSQTLVSKTIDVAVWHLFTHIPVELDADAMPHMAQRYADRHDLIEDHHYEPDCDHEPFMAVLEFLDIHYAKHNIADLMHNIQTNATDHPMTGTVCRVRGDIAFDMMKWPLLKTRTLIGIYAGIGQDQSHWLSYSRIQALAGGYPGASSVPKGRKKTNVPTLKQVRYWTEQLWMQGLFQVVVVNNRQRHYSIRFKDDAALEQHIMNTKKPKKQVRKISI